MKMYICTSDENFEFLITTDKERAFQLYATYLALRAHRSSKAWVCELIPEKIIPPHSDRLNNPLAGFVEGFLRYRNGETWVVQPFDQVFEKLSAHTSKGDAA